MATPFRFRDLPAEMRNRIIAFAVLEPEPIELYNVSPPAITAVSRELRRESMAVFFWENTFLVRVYSDIGYGFYWNEVAHSEETLSLDNFLAGPAVENGLPPDDIATFEEMRRQTRLAGAIQLRPQSRAWLVSLPRRIVRFRRVDFAVFDDWALFAQQQPAGQLDRTVVIPTERDAGFEVRWVWGGGEHSLESEFWLEYLRGEFLEELCYVMAGPQRRLASLGWSDLCRLALTFMLWVDGTPAPHELED